MSLSLQESYEILSECIINEAYQENGTIDGSFNGKKFTAKIKTDNPDSKLMSKVQSVIKTVGSISLYNYLYESDKNFYRDEVNTDSYYDGKKIESGKDLMNSIEINHKNSTIFVNDRRNTIYFCGEYWVDPEHGFSITFPGGKFVKADKALYGELQLRKERYDSHWIPQFTFMGLYSDSL